MEVPTTVYENVLTQLRGMRNLTDDQYVAQWPALRDTIAGLGDLTQQQKLQLVDLFRSEGRRRMTSSCVVPFFAIYSGCVGLGYTLLFAVSCGPNELICGAGGIFSTAFNLTCLLGGAGNLLRKRKLLGMTRKMIQDADDIEKKSSTSMYYQTA